MKKFYTLIICLGFLQMTFGQVTTNYNAKWFFGVNTGLTWQTTDVANKTNGGWGLTLGRSFNYHTGSFVSFDIRGRFLRGFWYGQDRDTSDFIIPNQTLSQGATNYRDSLGYSVNNFQAENYLLNLELVAHFNRIRENTRWDPYIFGGIGMNWRQTYGDYLNRDEITGGLTMYNWDVNNLGRSAIRKYQDGVYETALDGNKQDSYNFGLSHSLGFGLGYQVGKAVTIGLEHKTTVTRTDAFDGYIADSKYENDIYHYTNAYIQFRLFGRYRDEVKQENLPPDVKFTQPDVSGTTVSNPNYYVQARIKHVFDRENVMFTFNGVNTSGFTYNTNSDLFAANVTLVEGSNTLILSGTNQFGIDSETTVIIYKPELILPPVVSFIQPNVNPTTVTQATYNVVGNVLNVKDKSEVSVTFNGSNRNDFNFNGSNGNVTLNVNLLPGSNTVQITGTNSAGTDSESTIIIYNAPVPVTPPVVFFTDPGSTPITVGNSSYVIRGKVQFVDNNSGVKFTQNGSNKTNFTFNPTTDDFTYTATLAENSNTFVLTGTNPDGTASATTVIIYKRTTTNPPVATIYNPSSNTENVSAPQYPFGGSITNITTSSQAKLTLNGVNVSNFNFNASTGAVTSTLTLVPGSNSVTLTGTNADGTSSDQATIIYSVPQPVQPPVVFYTDPASSPITVNNASYTIRGKVLNVDGQQNVTFKKNGANQSGFSYNATTDEFVSTVSLNQGQNTFELIGTNSAGTATASTIITLNVPAPQPPIVTITNPNGATANTNIAQYPFVGNVQHVTTRSQVKMTVNGSLYNGFNFNTSTGLVTADLTLNTGSNTVTLKGTNIDGEDIEQVTIVYTPVVTINPPVVTFINPGSSPTNVNNASYNVTATVANVNAPSGVNISHNGNNVSVFTFGSNNLSFSLNLSEGPNVIVVTGTNTGGVDSKSTNIIYTKPVVTPAPIVTFVNPPTSPTNVTLANYNVQATVLNVSGASDITVKVNGTSISGFNYASTTKLVTFTANLNEGPNTIEVKGTNSAGSDTKSTVIKYTKPVVTPAPIVAFVNPPSSPTNVTLANYNVQATVLNVSGASEITVKVNGANLSNFNYASTTKLVTFTANLNEGPNTIEVTGTNSAGTDTKSTVIKYTKPVVVPQPIVTFINPASSGTTVSNANYDVRATVLNVSGSSDISVKVNGTSMSGFTYSSTTKIVQLNAVLALGNNTIEIKGTNSAGSDVKTTNIVYQCNKPVITSITPSSTSYTTADATLNFVASVTNIASASQVAIKAGSRSITSNFNPVNNQVTASFSLSPGINVIEVEAANSCGSQKVTYTITRTVCNSPTLTLGYANVANNQTTLAPSFTMVLDVTEITSQSQISVLLDNKTIPSNFNAAKGTIEVNYNLLVATSTFVVTVTNTCGSKSYTHVVTRSKSPTKVQPTVAITTPATSPTTVANGTYTLMFSTTNIIDKAEIIVRVNGEPVAVVFDKNTNSGSAALKLNSGSNVITVTATNPVGAANASTTIINTGK